MKRAIYVAGGMGERKMIRLWIVRLEAAGFVLAHDWTKAEPSVAGGDSWIAPEQARELARDDLRGVRDADVVWHIVANYKGSRGAYVETGYALALKKHLVVSGPTWRSSIFHHLAHVRFDAHEDAFAYLTGL